MVTAIFRFLWLCIVSKVWRERKPTRCNNHMFIINFCLNMFRASLRPSSREQRPCITACGVLRWFCWMWLVAVVERCVVGGEHCEGYCSTSQGTWLQNLYFINHLQCSIIIIIPHLWTIRCLPLWIANPLSCHDHTPLIVFDITSSSVYTRTKHRRILLSTHVKVLTKFCSH